MHDTNIIKEKVSRICAFFDAKPVLLEEVSEKYTKVDFPVNIVAYCIVADALKNRLYTLSKEDKVVLLMLFKQEVDKQKNAVAPQMLSLYISTIQSIIDFLRD